MTYDVTRHPQYAAVAARVQAATNAAIARELGVDRRTVARIRAREGVPAWTNATTAAQKLDRHSTRRDDGHTVWNGRTNNGTPVIRQGSREVPAAAVAFERRTGRAPEGVCRADCGAPHCLTPEHVADDVERRRVRLQLRAVYGMAKPWDVCPKGLHSWDEHGRIEPDLTIYCRACNTDRARKARATGKEES